MDIFERARPRGALVACVGAVAALAGCQSYDPLPLDVAGHRDRFDARLEGLEPLRAFAERLGAAGGAAERFDLSDGLDAAEGEVLALFYNADLRLARLQAGVALASAEHAGRWADPEFGFDGAEVLSPEGPFEYGLMLSLTIPISGRLSVERARAEASHEAELRRVVDLEWATRARVREAWARWTVALERERLLGEVEAQATSLAGIVERLESLGELPRVEARTLRMELIGLRSDRARAELEARQSRAALLGLMGIAPGTAIELVPAFPEPDVALAADPLERLIEANTALAVRRAEYRVAEESLRLEVREQYPDIRIGGGYGNEGDDRLLLGVSLPIPILNANKGGIAEARARRDAARMGAYVEFERLAARLDMVRSELESARARRSAFEAELIPLVEAQAEETARLVELGEVDTLLLLESLRRGYDVRDRLLELRLAEARAAIELAQLLGPRAPLEPAPVPSPTSHERPTATEQESDR